MQRKLYKHLTGSLLLLFQLGRLAKEQFQSVLYLDWLPNDQSFVLNLYLGTFELDAPVFDKSVPGDVVFVTCRLSILTYAFECYY